MADRSLLVSDFINLKEKVKSEMLRRNGNGSVVEYGSETYDYETVPAAGGLILREHPEKNLVPLRAVNPTGLPETISETVLLDEIVVMETLIEALKAQPDAATSNNDCAGACTGMCVSICTGSCTGDCTGGCSTTCTGSCSGSCTGSCVGGCSTSCVGTCDGCSGGCSGCGSGCAFTCTGSCSTSCSGGCQFGQQDW